jgi:hypothetical protein
MERQKDFSRRWMIAQFPPSALRGVKKGDAINVDLALKDNGPEPAGAKGRQEQRRTGKRPPKGRPSLIRKIRLGYFYPVSHHITGQSEGEARETATGRASSGWDTRSRVGISFAFSHPPLHRTRQSNVEKESTR